MKLKLKSKRLKTTSPRLDIKTHKHWCKQDLFAAVWV